MAEKDGNKGLGAGRDVAKRPLVAQRGVRGAQLRTPRKDGWTEKRRRMFIETLAATCNVSEAARVAGMNQSTAYSLKGRDAGFAREWAKALSIGYAELEALLLRQALFGTEEEEVVLDAEGMVKSRKVKRGHPHVVAVRLLTAHARKANEVRAGEEADRPDGADSIERLRSALAEVRRRTG